MLRMRNSCKLTTLSLETKIRLVNKNWGKGEIPIIYN
jgi:hypothetical protein